jgi:hypothetical protein
MNFVYGLFQYIKQNYQNVVSLRLLTFLNLHNFIKHHIFMKKQFKLLVFGLLVSGSQYLIAQTARVQVIHNCADAAAATVDIWVAGAPTPLIDNFQFRTAVGFTDLPAGLPLTLQVKGPNSVAADAAIWQTPSPITLTANSKYVVIANGIVSASGYSNPQPFGLNIYALGEESTVNTSEVRVNVFHGATDAPTVDVEKVPFPTAQVVNDLSYGNFTGYVTVPEVDLNLQVRTSDNNTAVAEYAAPLATLNAGGLGVVVFASGFLNPAANSNGAAFGLFAALPTGTVLPLPSAAFTPAKVQIIHNSADAAAAVVDIWLNGALQFNNVAFRTATGFIDFPVAGLGQVTSIAITGPDATSAANPVAQFDVNLVTDRYVVIANGIASPTGYNPNPPIALHVHRGAVESVANNQTSILVYHGATDAPAVDVETNPAGPSPLVNGAAYSNFAQLPALPLADYSLDLQTDAGDNFVARYSAPVSSLGLGGQAITVLASGFLNPAANSNGAKFGLWVALPAGGALVNLPADSLQIQIIHNSADAAAASVDVYYNGGIAANNFAFRTATPFLKLPVNPKNVVHIAGPTSTDTVGALLRVPLDLPKGNYIATADGIASPTGYTPSPALTVYPYAGARLAANVSTNVDLLVFHGCTDAPIVDVKVNGTSTTLVNDIAYGQYQGYVSVPASNVNIDVTLAAGSPIVETYTAPLAAFPGFALTVLASGFLNPAVNSNGAGFGLWVASVAGGALIPLPKVTGIEENTSVEGLNIYPNPASSEVFVEFNLAKNEKTTIRLSDLSGKVLSKNELGGVVGNQRISLNTSELSRGLYLVEVITNIGRITRKLSIQ